MVDRIIVTLPEYSDFVYYICHLPSPSATHRIVSIWHLFFPIQTDGGNGVDYIPYVYPEPEIRFWIWLFPAHNFLNPVGNYAISPFITAIWNNDIG